MVKRLLFGIPQWILIFFLSFPFLLQLNSFAQVKWRLAFSFNQYKFFRLFFILFNIFNKLHTLLYSVMDVLINFRIEFPMCIWNQIDFLLVVTNHVDIEHGIKYSLYLFLLLCNLYRNWGIVRFNIDWVILVIKKQNRCRLVIIILLIEFCHA